MEENKTKTTPLNNQVDAKKENEGKVIDQAQLQAVLRQAEARMQQMAEQMHQLDQMLRDKTIDQLFEVLKYSVHFDEEFVSKSAKCIEGYLSKVAFGGDEDTKESDVESKKED